MDKVIVDRRRRRAQLRRGGGTMLRDAAPTIAASAPQDVAFVLLRKGALDDKGQLKGSRVTPKVFRWAGTGLFTLCGARLGSIDPKGRRQEVRRCFDDQTHAVRGGRSGHKPRCEDYAAGDKRASHGGRRVAGVGGSGKEGENGGGGDRWEGGCRRLHPSPTGNPEVYSRARRVFL